jgi:low affinity Fe/Cu permease
VFTRFAHWCALAFGSPIATVASMALIVLWAVSGPLFGYSDTWQLVINTFTTVVTYIMVFILQHTQNHDARAMQLKLDELVRAVEGARDKVAKVEEQSDDVLDDLAATEPLRARS